MAEIPEKHILTDVEVDRVDLVDYPCVPKARILIIKNKGGEKIMAEETKELEEMEKSLEDAAKMIEQEMDKVKDEAKHKRLNLILANLKGLLKKAEDSDDKDKEKDKAIEKSLFDELKAEISEEMKEEIDKAGKRISKDTAEELTKIAEVLKSVCDSLESMLKADVKKPQYEKPYGEYEKPYGYPKPAKKDVANSVIKMFQLYKAGTMSDDEMKDIVDKLSEMTLQEKLAEE